MTSKLNTGTISTLCCYEPAWFAVQLAKRVGLRTVHSCKHSLKLCNSGGECSHIVRQSRVKYSSV